MHKYIVAIVICLFCACTMKKVSKVKIKNTNNYPIHFQVTALNLTYECDIKANDTHEGQFDWTELEKKDGSFQLVVTHQNSSKDTFSSSYFYNGELYNYLNYTVRGHEVLADVSN